MSASLRISLRVVGSRGELRVRNPLAPQFFGRTVLSIDGRPRVKQGAGRTSTYSHQLEAFCAAVLDGTSISTGVDDAVANMVVIDDVYRAAGLAPRTPTG